MVLVHISTVLYVATFMSPRHPIFQLQKHAVFSLTFLFVPPYLLLSNVTNCVYVWLCLLTRCPLSLCPVCSVNVFMCPPEVFIYLSLKRRCCETGSSLRHLFQTDVLSLNVSQCSVYVLFSLPPVANLGTTPRVQTVRCRAGCVRTSGQGCLSIISRPTSGIQHWTSVHVKARHTFRTPLKKS